jgi:hypothetical protein
MVRARLFRVALAAGLGLAGGCANCSGESFFTRLTRPFRSSSACCVPEAEPCCDGPVVAEPPPCDGPGCMPGPMPAPLPGPMPGPVPGPMTESAAPPFLAPPPRLSPHAQTMPYQP